MREPNSPARTLGEAVVARWKADHAATHPTSGATPVPPIPDRVLRFTEVHCLSGPALPTRWIACFEADIDDRSQDRNWGIPAEHAVFRFETDDRALVESITPGDRFTLRVARAD